MKTDVCGLCSHILSGVPGGWVYEDEYWAVGTLPDMEAPGWVTLLCRRHAEGLVSLTHDELVTLGPLAAKVSRALQAVSGAENVYFMWFGDRFLHFHVLLIAREPSAPHRGPRLPLHIDDYRNIDEARKVADKLREVLAEANAPP